MALSGIMADILRNSTEFDIFGGQFRWSD